MRAIVQPAAVKALAALPKKDRASLLRKIEMFAENPFAPNSSAKPLHGHPQVVRIRHGDWRAVCRIDRASDVVIVEAIGNRREIYR
ncbi:MAG TPA: type II toxin-antitoxin system RelE/ParE family toxin [Stellaceae bacterium]|nr:type II toxin-antitoxin system RelE/ParE family toxin [Stellaceae bacterium]